MKRAPLVNTLDHERVRESVVRSGTPPSHVQSMLNRLDRARRVRPDRVPPDLVTMNSVVRIVDLNGGDEDVYVLRYDSPRPAAPHETTVVTIHDLLGAELLGRWVGDTIEFRGRRGPVRLRVGALDYQPERAGDLDL